MPDPIVIDTALQTGASIAGGGGLVAVLVRFLFKGVSDRLDGIEETLKDQRKERERDRKEDKAERAELLTRIVKTEMSIGAAWKQLDALVTPAPRPHRRKKR